MHEEPQVVKVVADEFGDHLPVWFPPPIFDDASMMPVSAGLVEEFRYWNLVGQGRAGNPKEIAEHYRVGLLLAQRLADEIGSAYRVEILMAGEHPGWTPVTPAD
ncbi:orotate phosphoribosyltransferase [Microbacterium testaceum StLB037]|uniref:Orotate phosphoribosyltransferase n=1 Tax=Microbacterium testaceum (strain StLB037) TaxID=979556 RepID=E8N8S4_MICTS|nr:hypothetical protein [Microbacterium testaceum]BAJ73133.1 orotate phosphoribosyltransferase [Microbacterium testaceum StLB037]